MKTAVLYATHCKTESLEYFLKNGYIETTGVDYYFCINDPTLELSTYIDSIVTRKLQNIYVHNGENIGLDFGAWSEVLFKYDIASKYDYFIFLNNTCTGPFLPVYIEKNWIDIVTEQLTSDVKLVGSTINYYYGNPHIQSYFFCTDKCGLNITIKSEIFSKSIREKYKNVNSSDINIKCKLICDHEIRLSQVILDAGYNIKCFAKAFHDIDFRVNRNSATLKLKCGQTEKDIAYPKWYFGIDIHPLEVIFFKSNRNISEDVLKVHKLLGN